MLQMLINFIFNIILTIVQIVLSPFFNALFALFPAVGQYFSHITEFFSSAIMYVGTILRWFLFTPEMWTLLFDYYVIKYGVYILVVAIKFTITMYNKLKP